MIKAVKFIRYFFILPVSASCSAHDSSPSDQLIEGPFDITVEWQKVEFYKPLEVAPCI